MSNFRDNIRKVFHEGFSVKNIYGVNDSNNYHPKILDEDGNEKDMDDDLSDPTSDEKDDTNASPSQKNSDSDNSDDAITDDSADDTTGSDSSKDPKSSDEQKKRPQPDPITPPEPLQVDETPEQKVNRLYTDTGDVEKDYSITNENNIRLGKFKFENAGIVLDKVLSEKNLQNGISTKDIENLLTPEQNEIYKEKNRELRIKYPLIDMREKMCLIHNARIPLSKRDDKWNEIPIDDNQRKQAYLKVNSYFEQNFTKYWQDKTKYVDFLKTIKINFDDKPAIRSNLINSRLFINEDNANIIALDKVYTQIPKSIQELILDNSDDPIFVQSNIFRTLNSSFDQEVGSSGSLYVILNKENMNIQDDDSDKNTEPVEEQPKDTDTEPKEEKSAPEKPDNGIVPIGKDVEI